LTGLEFFKMSASGNDFIVIDNRDGKVYGMFGNPKDFAVKICRQHHSVGADGLILIEASQTADFQWRFFNGDGSEAEMCGNGGRCAARFASVKGIAEDSMVFETMAGRIKAEVKGTRVKLQLTSPVELKLDYPVALEEKEIFLSSVNTGVPHAVVLVDDVDHVPVEDLGRHIRYHKVFGTKGTNVNFVQIMDKGTAKIRTYERGVEGETYACGTGAVAVSIILREKGLIKSPASIWTRGGEILQVHVNEDVYLEGDTRIIYVAQLGEEALL
jgi:diaminopimelate epimerase